jgi:16S rRNA processing protein RimM
MLGVRRVKGDSVQLIVAVIGPAHGLKGEVKLDVRTDIPQRRLAPGAMLETDPPEFGPLTVARTREYKGATFAVFSECTDRNAAEQLRGVALVVETDEDEEIEEDAWYPHELIGLEVLDTDGFTLGEVIGMEPMPAQDLIVVRELDGTVTRVPFVKEIVTEVDPDDHCIVVDPPGGLFASDAEEPADPAESDGPANEANA